MCFPHNRTRVRLDFAWCALQSWSYARYRYAMGWNRSELRYSSKPNRTIRIHWQKGLESGANLPLFHTRACVIWLVTKSRTTAVCLLRLFRKDVSAISSILLYFIYTVYLCIWEISYQSQIAFTILHCICHFRHCFAFKVWTVCYVMTICCFWEQKLYFQVFGIISNNPVVHFEKIWQSNGHSKPLCNRKH